MIPRCGAADRFNPFWSPLKRYKGGFAGGESEQYQKRGGARESERGRKKKTFIPLSIFVTLKALGLTELRFNVICRKAKNVSALMLHYPRIKNARVPLFCSR